MADKTLDWQIAARPSAIRALPEGREKRMASKAEKAKASIRTFVEHPFRIVKRQFHYTKVRFKGLAKDTAQIITLFALANLWHVRRKLLLDVGVLRP